jgi:hypothetical protein
MRADTPSSHSGPIEPGAPKRSGGPFAVIGALLVVWVAGRSVLWENPFPAASALSPAASALAQALTDARTVESASSTEAFVPLLPQTLRASSFGDRPRSPADRDEGAADRGLPARILAGHEMLWHAALTSDARGVAWHARHARRAGAGLVPASESNATIRPAYSPVSPAVPQASATDRWSLSAWAFARQSMGGAPVTAGPAPVYGASQAGANLHYRLAPSSGHDPRAFARVTRALIDSGETEIAAGFSARPAARVPLRVAAELRATDNVLGRDLRPSAFVITELPAIALPAGLSAEVYAAAGYVGGDAATGFADGQTSITRSVADFKLAPLDPVRVSLAAAAWGGAQRGVYRLDIGPTLRMDMRLGEVPARVSIDYREQIAGDAAPASGIAATLSTQF